MSTPFDDGQEACLLLQRAFDKLEGMTLSVTRYRRDEKVILSAMRKVDAARFELAPMFHRLGISKNG